MNCKHFQKIILSDYLDGRLSAAKKARVDSHLAVCPDCREVLSMAKELLKEPFRKEEKPPVPSYLSYRIQERIRQEQTESSFFTEFFRSKVQQLLLVPRPALVFATVVLFIAASLGVFRVSAWHAALNKSTIDAAHYIYDLGTGTGMYATGQEYGSAIEGLLL